MLATGEANQTLLVVVVEGEVEVAISDGIETLTGMNHAFPPPRRHDMSPPPRGDRGGRVRSRSRSRSRSPPRRRRYD
jgi:hypothetical protein